MENNIIDIKNDVGYIKERLELVNTRINENIDNMEKI